MDANNTEHQISLIYYDYVFQKRSIMKTSHLVLKTWFYNNTWAYLCTIGSSQDNKLNRVLKLFKIK